MKVSVWRTKENSFGGLWRAGLRAEGEVEWIRQLTDDRPGGFILIKRWANINRQGAHSPHRSPGMTNTCRSSRGEITVPVLWGTPFVIEEEDRQPTFKGTHGKMSAHRRNVHNTRL